MDGAFEVQLFMASVVLLIKDTDRRYIHLAQICLKVKALLRNVFNP